MNRRMIGLLPRGREVANVMNHTHALIFHILWLSAILSLLSPPPIHAAVSLTGKVILTDCTIRVNGSPPAYVVHAVNELRDYLEAITGREVHLGPNDPKAQGTIISVGTEISQDPNGGCTGDELGAEGYLIRSRQDGHQVEISISGATDKGTMQGVNALLRRIRAEGSRAYLESDLHITSTPSFRVRGFHFNGWMFNNPYSFRTWTEAQWKDYIDILGYQHVNLLYLWPFMEIIPLPLSKEDTDYLEEVRRVVAYAQERHGMEVWMMQAANRVAQHSLGVSDPRYRPYWREAVQVDLNPGDPEAFKLIMASHAALYKIVNNADGVCTIDTDPGSYPGSSLEEYSRILQGCRELLDQYNVHGRQAKLIHWMWMGWGGEEHRENLSWQKQTIETLQARVPEPWWLVAGQDIYLPVVQKANALDKTVFLRYATIESEPSYPSTLEPWYVLSELGKMFSLARNYPGLQGVMGNAQTPILQYPGIYHFLSCSWDLTQRNLPVRQVLQEAIELLYPEQTELIAEAYLALSWTDATDADRLAQLVARLDRVLAENRLGRAGLIGRKLFPDYAIIARSLLMQLRLRAALQRMRADLKPDSPRSECFQLMEDCLDAYLTWDSALGWHQLWGAEKWQLGCFRQDAGFQESLRRLRRILGSNQEIKAFFEELAERLGRKHGREYAVKNATNPTENILLGIQN